MFLRRAAFQRLFAQRWGHALRHSVKFSCVKRVTDGLRRENNLADRERGGRLGVKRATPVGCPPAPNPSPIRRETLAPSAGVFLCGQWDADMLFPATTIRPSLDPRARFALTLARTAQVIAAARLASGMGNTVTAERTKTAIAEQRKFGALLKMLRAGLT
jgi:hypothetical protein